MKTLYCILLTSILLSCSSTAEEIKKDTVIIKPEAIKFDKKGLDFTGLANKNIDSAFYYFDKAIEIDPNYSNPHSNKANLYIELGNEQNALSELKIVTELNPDLAEAWIQYGMALDYYGQKDESKLAYGRGIKIFNERIETCSDEKERNNNVLNRGFALFLMGDPSYKKDFEELKENEDYQMFIHEVSKTSKEEMLNDLMTR